MGFLNSIFGNNEEEQPQKVNVNWSQLTTLAQLDAIIDLSFDKPVMIFKHSTRCGISRTVLRNFEATYNSDTKVTPYFLDLLAYRDISNAISDKFNVTHQSPQLLLIKDGKSVYNASHSDIDAQFLAGML